MSICIVCAALGLPFISAGIEAAGQLAASSDNVSAVQLLVSARAALVGAFLWAVSASFLLSAAIKLPLPGNQRRWLTARLAVRSAALACLWLTVPIAGLWVYANLLAQ